MTDSTISGLPAVSTIALTDVTPFDVTIGGNTVTDKVTLGLIRGGVVSVKDFGATGDGVTNDSTALANAAASGASRVIVPAGTYLNTATIAVPAGQVWEGTSRKDSKIKKGANGTMMTLAEGAGLLDLYLDGDGANFTGKGVLLSGTAGKQFAHRCTILDFEDFCIEFETAAGSQSCFIDCLIARYSGTTSDSFCAVGHAAAQQLTAKPRKFIGCETNGTYFIDFGGCNNTYVIGCFVGGFKFSDESRGVFINATRWANQATCTVRGHQVTIQGGDILPDLTLTGSGPIILGPAAFTGTITDSGSAGQNMVYMEETTYTPTWTQPTGTPVVGDGTLTGSWSRDGDIVHANVNLTIGASTTFGTGAFRFSLPIATTSTTVQTGIARLLDATTTLEVGVVVLAASGSYVTINTSASLVSVGTTDPWTWATNDVIQLSISYSV